MDSVVFTHPEPGKVYSKAALRRKRARLHKQMKRAAVFKQAAATAALMSSAASPTALISRAEPGKVYSKTALRRKRARLHKQMKRAAVFKQAAATAALMSSAGSPTAHISRAGKMDGDFFDATQAIPFDDLSDCYEEESGSGQRKLVAHLKVICQKGNPETIIPVYEGQNIVGRSDKCDIHIPVKALSKEHAVIEVRGSDHLIYDKGSRNRSRRGKLFLSPDVRYELRDGDKVTFADVHCIYNRVVDQKSEQENEDGGSETGSETGSESMLNTQEANLGAARDVEATLMYHDDEDNVEEEVSEPSSDILQPTQAYHPDGGGPITESRLAAVQDTLTFAEASDDEESAPAQPFTSSTYVMETPVAHPPNRGRYVDQGGTPTPKEAANTPNTSFIPETQVFEETDDEDDAGAETVIPATQDFGSDCATQQVALETPEKLTKQDGLDPTQAYSMDIESTVDADVIRANRRKTAGAEKDGGETVAYDMDIESTQTADEIRAARGSKKGTSESLGRISASQAPTECFPSDEEEEVDEMKESEVKDHVPSNIRECSTLAFEYDDDDEMEEDGVIQEQNNNKKNGPQDEEATQAFGSEEATQAFEDESDTIGVNGDAATLNIGADDATQVVGDVDAGDDATQVITDDATQAVDAGDATVAVAATVEAADTQLFGADNSEATQILDKDNAPTQVLSEEGATQIIEDDADTEAFSENEPSNPQAADEAATQLIDNDCEPTLCINADDIMVPGASHLPAAAAEEATQLVPSSETQLVYESDEEDKKENRPRPRHSVMFPEATQLVQDADATQMFEEEELEENLPTVAFAVTPFIAKSVVDESTPTPVSELDETQIVDDESTPIFTVVNTPLVLAQKQQDEMASPDLRSPDADLDATQIVEEDTCPTLEVEATPEHSQAGAVQHDMSDMATVPIDEDGFAKPFPKKKLRMSRAHLEEDSADAETQDFSEGLPDLDEVDDGAHGGDADSQPTQAYAEDVESDAEGADDDDDETRPMSEPLIDEIETSEKADTRPCERLTSGLAALQTYGDDVGSPKPSSPVRAPPDDAATQAYKEEERQAIVSPSKSSPNPDDAETQAYQEHETQAAITPTKSDKSVMQAHVGDKTQKVTPNKATPTPDDAETQAYEGEETQAVTPTKAAPPPDDAETQAYEGEETQAVTPTKATLTADDAETQAHEGEEKQAVTPTKAAPHSDDAETQPFEGEETQVLPDQDEKASQDRTDKASAEQEVAPPKKGKGRSSRGGSAGKESEHITNNERTGRQGRRSTAAKKAEEMTNITAQLEVPSASTAKERRVSPHGKKVTFDVSSEEDVVEVQPKRTARGRAKKAAPSAAPVVVVETKQPSEKSDETDDAKRSARGKAKKAVPSATAVVEVETKQTGGKSDETDNAKRSARGKAKKAAPSATAVVEVETKQPGEKSDETDNAKGGQGKRKATSKAAKTSDDSAASEKVSNSRRGRSDSASRSDEAQVAEAVPETVPEVPATRRGRGRAVKPTPKSEASGSTEDGQVAQTKGRSGRKGGDEVAKMSASAEGTTTSSHSGPVASKDDPAKGRAEVDGTKSTATKGRKQNRREQQQEAASNSKGDEPVVEVKSEVEETAPAASRSRASRQPRKAVDQPDAGTSKVTRGSRTARTSSEELDSSTSRERKKGSQASKKAEEDQMSVSSTTSEPGRRSRRAPQATPAEEADKPPVRGRASRSSDPAASEAAANKSRKTSTRNQTAVQASEAAVTGKPSASQRSSSAGTRGRRGAVMPEVEVKEEPVSEPISRARSSRSRASQSRDNEDAESVTSVESSQSSRRGKRSASPADVPVKSRRNRRGAATSDAPPDGNSEAQKVAASKRPVIKEEPASPPPDSPPQRRKRGAAVKVEKSEPPTKTSRRAGKAAATVIKQEPVDVDSPQDSSASTSWGPRQSRIDGPAQQSQESPKKGDTLFRDVSSPTCRASIPIKFEHTPILRRRTIERKPRVMFTGLIDESGQKTVQDLGGELVESVHECTHLVTDKVRRTVKFLCGMARGILIVSPTWLARCRDSRTFIDAGVFVLKDVASEASFNFSMSKTLDAAMGKPLLDGYRIHVTKKVRPDPSQMKDIITCAGGEFLATMPKKFEENVVVISCEEDKALCKPALTAKIPVVGAEFLLTGILRHATEFDIHRLFEEPAPVPTVTSAGSKRQSTAASQREPSKRRRR